MQIAAFDMAQSHSKGRADWQREQDASKAK